jgi:hypothetical protein
MSAAHDDVQDMRTKAQKFEKEIERRKVIGLLLNDLSLFQEDSMLPWR